MISSTVPTEKELENEDEKLLFSKNTVGPIFRTEINLIVNASDDERDRKEGSVVLRDKKLDSVNKYTDYTSHENIFNSTNRFSTVSLSESELKHNSELKTCNKQTIARHTFSFEDQTTSPHNSEKGKIPNEKCENSSEILSGHSPFYYSTNLDVNSNELMTKISEDENEYIPCVIRKSESIDTIDKIEKELSYFVMDNKKKEKKRPSSFRMLFSVPFFGKDKKKKEKDSDNRQSGSHNNDNYQNETNCNSFIRNSPQRHTVGCDHSKNKKITIDAKYNGYQVQEEPSPEIIKQYANHHINKFRKIRQSFEYPNDDELSNIRNENTTDTNSSTIAQHITKYIDTSSSASTLESDKRNAYQHSVLAQSEPQQTKQHEFASFHSEDKLKFARHESLQRETPPRAQDTYQIVNIVKPKARLPINSGRPLPNPYQHDEDNEVNDYGEEKTISLYTTQENEKVSCPQLNEIYGTVFDAVALGKSVDSYKTKSFDSHQERKISPTLPKSPKSPSLEGSKLKLPPNREIFSSQPRMQSPLPSAKVSTEKIIATELLKNSKPNMNEKDCKNILNPRSDQSLSPSRQFQELNMAPQAESTPDNGTSVSEAINALRSELEVNDHNLKQELDQIKSTLQNLTHSDSASSSAVQNIIKNEGDKYKTSPMGTLGTSSRSSIAASLSPQPISAESIRYSSNAQTLPLSSPNDEIVELRQKNSVSPKFGTQSFSRSPTSPNKEEIRKSVEAYYWKEIKRIKEQEDYEIYLSHLHFSQGGYAEDPIFNRRSRGIEDSRARRSSSVPRNVRQQLTFDNSNQSSRQMVIPEGRTVLYQPRKSDIYGYIPPKNSVLQAAARNTIQPLMSNTSRESSSEYGTYKPIFRRGSLSGNTYQPVAMNQYKKVSFSNSQQVENLACWPTKNGFTKSPPQRRLEKVRSSTLEDDVFLPPVQNHQNVHYQRNSEDNSRMRIKNKYNSETESSYENGQNKEIYGYNSKMRNSRPTYYNSDSEALYSMQRRFKTLSHQEMENLRNSQLREVNSNTKRHPAPMLTRHESIQLPEPTYGYARQMRADRRGSQEPNSVNRVMGSQNVIMQLPQRRDILITDNIYGQHIGYRNDPTGPIYAYSTRTSYSNEPLYVPKSVSVSNKVCDIYGRIHDTESEHGQIQATGVLMGQLQSSPSSPNFRRGTRLTASNNDMLLRRRQDNFEQCHDTRINKLNTNQQPNIGSVTPVRPLPPLPPTGRKVQNVNSKNTSSKKNTNSSKKKKK